jgi:arylsulfatase A-like enzyme
VLVIVADDLGYGELGCQGFSQEIPTHNIDSIAAYGVRFTSGYVSCPYCSPTRAGLLTGRYQQRFGHEFNPGPAALTPPTVGLPVTETTIGDCLRAAGYATGWIGKSHQGYAPQFHPLRRGFDEFYGFLGGKHDFFSAAVDPVDPIARGTEPVAEIDYTTDAFGREAADYIERHKDGPWLCYLAFNAVHAPLQATEKYLARFANVEDPKRKIRELLAKRAGLYAKADHSIDTAKLTARQIVENIIGIYEAAENKNKERYKKKKKD